MKKLFILALSLLAINGCKKDLPNSPVTIEKPQVKIVSPSDSSMVFDSTAIKIEATSGSAIKNVSIYIDQQLDSSRILTKEPYEFEWKTSNLPDQSVHKIFAKAVDNAGQESSTPEITVTISKLISANLTAKVLSGSQIKLKWKDNSSNETGFEVEQKYKTTQYSVIASLPPNSDSLIVNSNFNVNDSLFFRVRAVAGANLGTYSNEASAFLNFNAPAFINFETMSNQSVSLTWDDNSNIEDGFVIEKDEDGNGFTEIARVQKNVTAFVDSSLQIDKKYAYRIKCTSGSRESAYFESKKIQLVFNNSPIRVLGVYTGIINMSVNPDGKSIIAGGGLNVRLKDVSNNSNLLTFKAHNSAVNNVKYTHDGKFLVTSGANDSTIKIWSVPDYSLLRTIRVNSWEIYGIDISPDDKLIACTSVDNDFYVYNLADGSVYKKMKIVNFLQCVKFSPDGKYLAIGDGNGAIKVFDFVKFSLYRSIVLNDLGSNGVTSLEFSHDNKYLLIGVDNGNVKLYSIENSNIVYSVKADPDLIHCAKFTPDEKFFVTGGRGVTTKMWNAYDGTLFRQMGGHTNEVLDFGFSIDGTTLFSGGLDDLITMYSVNGTWQTL